MAETPGLEGRDRDAGLGDRRRAHPQAAAGGPDADQVRRLRHAAAAAVGRGGLPVEHTRATTDPGLRQDQVHSGGCLVVAGDGGDDAPHLLEAGQRQERRRAAVGLHAGEVETVLRLGELGRTVRVDGAAGVHVGVDQRCELRRRRQDRVEVETDLGQPGQVGSEPGDDDDLVDRPDRASVDAGQGQPPVGASERPRRCGTRSPLPPDPTRRRPPRACRGRRAPRAGRCRRRRTRHRCQGDGAARRPRCPPPRRPARPGRPACSAPRHPGPRPRRACRRTGSARPGRRSPGCRR